MAFDPISVILFILFIVVPIVNNLMKGSQRQGPPTRQPPPHVTRRTNPATDTPAAKDLEQRLEEARRRVQEAMADPRDAERSDPRDAERYNLPRPQQDSKQQSTRQHGSRQQGTRQQPMRQGSLSPQRPPRPQPPTPQLLRPQTLEQPARHEHRVESLDNLLSLEALPERPQSLETLMPLTGTSLKEAPPMRVSRAGGVKDATMQGRGVRFDGDSLMQGIIWHEILQEAPSRRRRRVSRR